MISGINNINSDCDTLKLTGVLRCYQSLADECGKLNASYSEYLEQVLKYELMFRETRTREILLKLAGFPVLKTLEQFDFKCSNVNKMQVQELANLQFIANKENVIFIGSPGTGKTHLATAIAHLATTQRIKVKFLTAADLFLQLEAAASQNKLSKYLSTVLGTASLLVIDEFGYLKLFNMVKRCG